MRFELPERNWKAFQTSNNIIKHLVWGATEPMKIPEDSVEVNDSDWRQ